MNLKFAAAVSLMAAAAVCAKDYSGAEIFTKKEYSYGKYEARIQMAAISGSVSSMFLYQNGSEQTTSERWVEIDIEIVGTKADSMQTNIITGKAGAQVMTPVLHPVTPATTEVFHTYGIEWTPDYVRWTVDGVEYRKVDKGDDLAQVENLVGTQGLRFNIWSSISESWVGPFDSNDLPIFEFIDWVKAYTYDENSHEFTLAWADNFNSFNSDRWGVGDYTFDDNRVDFTEKNVYTKDGILVLALTPKGKEQFSGELPQDEIIISDFESGSAISNTGAYWYAYTDAATGGNSTLSNAVDTVYDGFIVYKAGDNNTTGMIAMDGIALDKGESETSPNVNLALDFYSDKSAYAQLGECNEISYDYKGTGHNFKVVMVGDADGSLTGYNRHYKAMPASSEWTTVTMPWSELKQDSDWGTALDLDPAKIFNFIFEVKDSADLDYLYIDNVKCVGMTVYDPESSASVESSSSVVSSSSATTPASSSSKTITSSASESIYATASTAAFQASVHGSMLSINVASGSKVQVQVFDIMGHAVKTDVKNLSAGSHSMSLQSLPQGSYVVRVASGSSMRTLRMNVR